MTIALGQAVGALGSFAKQYSGEIGLAAGAASGIMQGVGGILAARQGRINAKILEKRGREAYAAKLAEGLQRAGTARARAAKGGADPNAGSAADVIRMLDAEGRVAALRERFAYQDAAAIAEREGQAALFGSILSGANTLLGASRRVDKPGGTPPTTPSGWGGTPLRAPSSYGKFNINSGFGGY